MTLACVPFERSVFVGAVFTDRDWDLQINFMLQDIAAGIINIIIRNSCEPDL